MKNITNFKPGRTCVECGTITALVIDTRPTCHTCKSKVVKDLQNRNKPVFTKTSEDRVISIKKWEAKKSEEDRKNGVLMRYQKNGKWLAYR